MVPSCGFSLEESGSTIPKEVVCSCSLGATNTRSPSGLIMKKIASFEIMLFTLKT
jgi:hypothetical protein